MTHVERGRPEWFLLGKAKSSMSSVGCMLALQLDIPYQKCLGPQCFWNICTYIILGWDPRQNTVWTYVSYISCIRGLKIILYNILNNFMHETKFHGVSCWHSKNLDYWSILDFQVKDAQPLGRIRQQRRLGPRLQRILNAVLKSLSFIMYWGLLKL
jgi:hypothetical protein